MKQLLKSLSPKHIFNSTKKDNTNSKTKISNKKNTSASFTKSEPTSFSSHSSSYSSESSENSSTHNHGVGGGGAPVRCKSEDLSLLRGSHPWTEEAFKMIDLDGDGKITRVELHALFKRVRANAASLSEEEIAAMIKDIDIDGDGCISLQELEAVGSALDPSGADEDDLKGAFGFFDADHDGKISAEELHAGFVALGDTQCTLADCRRMIEGVDRNRNGFVCFDDFCRMMSISSRKTF